VNFSDLAMGFKFLSTTILSVFFFFVEVALVFSSKISDDGTYHFKGIPRFIHLPAGLSNELSTSEATRSADKQYNAFIQRWGLAGMSVAVMKDGRLVYAKGFGKASRETGKLVEPTHAFRLASVSKLVTAVAALKLVEEGKLTLDQKVFGPEAILNTPEFCSAADPRTFDITVKHLLLHISGWSTRAYGDPMFQSLLIAERMKVPAPASKEAIIQYVLRKRLSATPGVRYDYSNFGYFILSQVIEKVAAMPYEQYVQEAVLHPLNIYDMQLAKNLREEKSPHEVNYYDHHNAGKKLSCYGTGELVDRTSGGTDVEMLSGAGAWIASPASMLRFLAAIDGFDSPADILSPATIELMTTPEVEKGPIMGWRANQNGKWIRTGTLIGTNALLVRQPDGISYMIVTNTNHWTGHNFNDDLYSLMNRTIAGVESWPDHNLFVNHRIASHSVNNLEVVQSE
jgi:CubicO group peptidase (beta-lactamase class C family)